MSRSESIDKPLLDIYLIRHAEKNQDGSALSKRGKKQAKLLAKKLKDLRIKKIYSSNLERCKQTAGIIKKILGVPLEIDSDLNEIEGNVKESPEKHTSEIRKIKGLWNKITKNRGAILIVGSGNINRVLIAIALNINPKNSRFVQIPTGLTHMEFFSKDRTRFDYVNSTDHLPKKLRIRQPY